MRPPEAGRGFPGRGWRGGAVVHHVPGGHHGCDRLVRGQADATARTVAASRVRAPAMHCPGSVNSASLWLRPSERGRRSLRPVPPVPRTARHGRRPRSCGACRAQAPGLPPRRCRRAGDRTGTGPCRTGARPRRRNHAGLGALVHVIEEQRLLVDLDEREGLVRRHGGDARERRGEGRAREGSREPMARSGAAGRDKAGPG